MPKEYREQQVKLKTLVVNEMLRLMQEGTKSEKLEIIKRIGPRCLPDELELSGQVGSYIIKRGSGPDTNGT